MKHSPDTGRMWQLYKDNSLGIAAVKQKVALLFRRHPDLLEKFSIFLPEQESMSSSDAYARGRGTTAVGVAPKKGRPTVQQPLQTALPQDDNDDDEDLFMPEAQDAQGLLLHDLRQQIIAQHGHESYRDFLKLLSLVSAGVLTPDDFASVLHEKMLTGNGALKANFVGLKALMGAKPTEFPAIADVDLTHCIKVGVSYKKLPREFLPPLCSGRTPFWNSVLNDEWVSVSSGREGFGQMKRTQYEVAMFLCEDDRYELDMLVEANLSTMRAIKQRLSELPESEREPQNMEEDAADAEGDVDDDFKSERVRTLRERPPTADIGAGEDELPVFFEGEILKPRHMRVIRMVYGDNWPEISALMHRAPGVTLRVLLKRLQRKDAEWRKTRRDMNRIWSTVYHTNYHKSLDFRSFQFKQADKKALSPQTLALEAAAIRKKAVKEMLQPHMSGTAFSDGGGMVCGGGGELTYRMDDSEVHKSIMSILRLSLFSSMCRSAESEGVQETVDALKDMVSAAAAACVASASGGKVPKLRPFRPGSGAERVELFFERFLHVFMGLEERSAEKLKRWLAGEVDVFEEDIEVSGGAKGAETGSGGEGMSEQCKVTDADVSMDAAALTKVEDAEEDVPMKKEASGDGDSDRVEGVARDQENAAASKGETNDGSMVSDSGNKDGSEEGLQVADGEVTREVLVTGDEDKDGVMKDGEKVEGEADDEAEVKEEVKEQEEKKEDEKEASQQESASTARGRGRGRGRGGRGRGGRGRGRGRWGHLQPRKVQAELDEELQEAMMQVVKDH